MLYVDAAHDGASVLHFFKSSAAVGKFGRVVVVNDAHDLHPRLRGRLRPDSCPARVVTPAAQAVCLPLTAGLAGRKEMRFDRLVLSAVRRQVGRRRRRRHLVDRRHRVGVVVDNVAKKSLDTKLPSLCNLFHLKSVTMKLTNSDFFQVLANICSSNI